MRAPSVRVVNYHLTPARDAARLDAQFAALAATHDPVSEDALSSYLATGRWPGTRPGVIPAFYNGYRDNFDVAAPLLDRHGLTGWFMSVPAYTDCPPAQQEVYAATRTLATIPGEYADGRSALSWDEMRALDGRHVIGSHTRSHTRVGHDDPGVIEDEIVGAQDDFRRNLGHPVRAFAWLSGGRIGENPLADAAVGRAGYEFLFSNFALQKLR